METVYFYSPGSCSLAGIVALEWLAVPYKLCRAEGDARESAAFRKVNPQGKVPALLVDGRPLAEMSAILMHLAARRPEKGLLAPPGTPRYDEENFWFSYLGSGFHAAFYPWFRPQRYFADGTRLEDVKAAAKEQIRGQYALVEKALAEAPGGGPYLFGATSSIFDVYLYAMSRWGRRIFDLKAEFPRVSAHQGVVEGDPAVAFALAIEKADAGARSPSGVYQGHTSL